MSTFHGHEALKLCREALDKAEASYKELVKRIEAEDEYGITGAIKEMEEQCFNAHWFAEQIGEDGK